MHRRSRRICEKGFGRNSKQRSRRPHCRERNQLVEPLQSRAQVSSYACSNENTRCESSSGQRMGKTQENIGALQLTKVKNKMEVLDEARNEGKTVHFASLMDICHLKNSELEPKIQKDKGRVTLRGDIVKDDSVSYAVYRNTNGLNHGPAWKIQSFLLSEICTVILWQDHYGKGNPRKFY